MLTIRSKSSPRVSFGRIALLIVALLVVVLVAGGAVLALLEPSPPVKHFEIPVSNDRLSR